MAFVMGYAPPSVQRARFLALLSNPEIIFPGDLLDREFDDEAESRLTGETLDWHQCRHWPVLATD